MLNSSKISNGINGIIKIPGDKSISHRSIIIPSIANGISEISNILMSDDVLNTLNAFEKMGVKIEKFKNKIIIYGKGLNSLKKPNASIYLGNSGTSARLLTGLLSAQKFDSDISGDKSLSSRPMKRITEPLEAMGAKFISDTGTLPLSIIGKKLKNINYEIKIPSAQVKSGMILAALFTDGKTKINESNITRNHTEIMLKYFGAKINIEQKISSCSITVEGQHELNAQNINVPSDLSSAAFFIVAAIINPNSNILLENININPSRDGILRALKLMGANIKIENQRIINEEIVSDIRVKSSQLSGCKLDEEMAKLMIDEYPILSIAASYANSPSVFKGLKELRVKESDRLELIRMNLEKCGVDCTVTNDSLIINPKNKYYQKNNKIKTDFDHRIAMSFAVMGTLNNTELLIEDSDSIKTSFPDFINTFNKCGGNLRA